MPDTRVPPPTVNLLQLTPELFQQSITAAVTAAVAANAGHQPQSSTLGVAAASVNAAAAPLPVIPRKEKKLAEFWTSRPTMWFRLFEGQFPATMSQDFRFDSLLNHLPSSALPFVDHILRAPGLTPYDIAKVCLIRHYEVSPRDKARQLRALSSLGDRTPSEMLHFMRSLLPGVADNALFEAIFLDLLPDNARDAAVKHDVLEDMADAADKVLAEAPTSGTISAVACGGPEQHDIAGVSRQVIPPSNSRRSQAKDASLCYIHARYGKGSFKCASS